jgi:hypothetical protein
LGPRTRGIHDPRLLIDPQILAGLKSLMHEPATVKSRKLVDCLHVPPNTNGHSHEVLEQELVQRGAPCYDGAVVGVLRKGRHREGRGEGRKGRDVVLEGTAERMLDGDCGGSMCRDGWQGLLAVGFEAAHVGGMVAGNPSGGFGRRSKRSCKVEVPL